VVAAFLVGLPLVELAFDPPARPVTGRIPVPIAGGTSTLTYDPVTGWVRDEEHADDAMVRHGALAFTVERTTDCAGARTAAVDRRRADEPAIPEDAGVPHRVAGLDGMLRTWTGPTTEGLLVTACWDGEGLVALAAGPLGSLSADGVADALAMIDSLDVR
jgi:hypothetical protein